MGPVAWTGLGSLELEEKQGKEATIEETQTKNCLPGACKVVPVIKGPVLGLKVSKLFCFVSFGLHEGWVEVN